MDSFDSAMAVSESMSLYNIEKLMYSSSKENIGKVTINKMVGINILFKANS